MSDTPTFYRVTLPPPIHAVTPAGAVLEQSFVSFVLYELLTHPQWRQPGAITLARNIRDTLLAATAGEANQEKQDWIITGQARDNLAVCMRQVKLHPELGPYQLDFVAAIVEAPHM